MWCKMHVIKCKGQIESLYRTYFLVLSSTGKCVHFHV